MTGDPLGASIAAFIEEKNRLGGTDKKRMMDYEAARRLFEGWCGSGTLLGAINKRKIGELRSLLAKLPPNHTKRFRERSLVEIIAIADAEDRTPLNPMTANSKYLAPCGWLCTTLKTRYSGAAGRWTRSERPSMSRVAATLPTALQVVTLVLGLGAEKKRGQPFYQR
jgi:hypothetical protein